jgi:hypothetical protein
MPHVDSDDQSYRDRGRPTNHDDAHTTHALPGEQSQRE